MINNKINHDNIFKSEEGGVYGCSIGIFSDENNTPIVVSNNNDPRNFYEDEKRFGKKDKE